MTLQKGDFIEIDFTGKVKDGNVFDSTRKEELEKLHHGHDHTSVVDRDREHVFFMTFDDMNCGPGNQVPHDDPPVTRH